MKLGTKITAVFAAVLMIVVAVGVLSYIGIHRIVETNRWVHHTYEVRERLDKVFSDLQDAETGQRGFILTGEDRYLEPYETAVGVLKKDLEAVDTLIRDNTEQQEDLLQLQTLSRKKIDKIKRTITLRRQAGMETALRVVISDSGKKIMDEIRALMARMEFRQGSLLEKQRRIAEKTARRSMLIVGLGVLLSLTIMGIAGVFFTRTLHLTDSHSVEDSSQSLFGMAIRYSFAIVMVGGAMALRTWLQSVGPMPPFFIFYPGILLVASVAGGGPGVLYTLLSVLAADYWYFPPVGRFYLTSPEHALALGIFGGAGLFLSIYAERLKRARRAEAVSITRKKELALLNKGNLMALDLDHRILRWSEGNSRLYGFAAQEVQGLKTYGILQTHFVQPMEQIHSELIERNYWEGEVSRRTKEGKALSVALLWALRRDDHGRPLEILEVSTDITRQKQAEESLQQYSEELAQQNEELTRQSEELAQQSEEMLETNEELQAQSEEVQALNAELIQREKMLRTLLDSARFPLGEQEVMERVCKTAQALFDMSATGTAVCEQQGEDVRILARSGFEGYDIPDSWLLTGSFVELVMQHDKTACLEDTSLEPTFTILGISGKQPFISVLSSPLHVEGKPIGAISIYSHTAQEWTTEHFRLIEWLAAQCSHTLEAMRLAAAVHQSQQQNEFLAGILENSSQAFGVGYPDGRLGLTNKAFDTLTGYDSAELRSLDWVKVLTPPEWREMERQQLKELSRTGLPVRYEKEYLRKDGTRVPIELLVSIVRDSEKNPLYFYSFVTDITERKRAEENRILLMREIDHRAKNALSVVQSVVRLTRAETIQEFTAAVEGRVAALARTHSLLAKSRWSGVDLEQVIREELEPYCKGDTEKTRLSGPPLLIAPEAVQSLGMVFHELATNAAKYGALSCAQGKVEVRWESKENGVLQFFWRELGGPSVREPIQRGFGSTLIGGTVGSQLGGSVNYQWHPEGLCCNFAIPNELIKHPGEPQSMIPVEPIVPKPPSVNFHKGSRILIIEDDMLIAAGIELDLRRIGYETVGPVGTVSDAIQLINSGEDLHAAVVDLNLHGEESWPVVELLCQRGVPYILSTGYSDIAGNLGDTPILEKPYSPERLQDVLQELLEPKESFVRGAELN